MSTRSFWRSAERQGLECLDGRTGRTRRVRRRPTPSTLAAGPRRCSSRTKSRGSSPPAGRPSMSPATAEITLEANPESVDQARLAGFRAAGVNRLSFGVQSFREPELRRLSRLHTADRARAAVAEARAAGFDNLSLDLMMWLPGAAGHRMARVGGRRHCARAGAPLALPARGVSECAAQRRHGPRPVVPGARRGRGGDVRDGDGTAGGGGVRAVRDLQRRASRTARRATTSSTGPTASGLASGAARIPPAGLSAGRMSRPRTSTSDGWSRRESPAIDHRPLSPEERLGDALFTGLRLTEGVNLDAIRAAYGVDVWARYGARARTVPSGGAAAAGGRADVADASGNASCSRSHDYFRIALELCFGLEYRPFV